MRKKTAIIISISSDIGYALCEDWIDKSFEIVGTYRTYSKKLEKLKKKNVSLIECDLNNIDSVFFAIKKIKSTIRSWDIIVFAPGLLTPIGNFFQIDFNEWENSVRVNFIQQLRILHGLYQLKRCNRDGIRPTVIFFAGGGVNNSVISYSAYTISKIALIKICELLDAENKELSFFIVGPGWVKTKIHNSTLNEKIENVENNLNKLKEKLLNNDFIEMTEVIKCINWLLSQPSEIISGRNYSVEYDKWGNMELIKKLAENENYYKLRRFGNDIKIEDI